MSAVRDSRGRAAQLVPPIVMTKTRTLPSRATASRSSGPRVLVVSSPSVTTISLVTAVSSLGPSSTTPSAVASNNGVLPLGAACSNTPAIAPRRGSSSRPTDTSLRTPRPEPSAGNNHRPTSSSPRTSATARPMPSATACRRVTGSGGTVSFIDPDTSRAMSTRLGRRARVKAFLVASTAAGASSAGVRSGSRCAPAATNDAGSTGSPTGAARPARGPCGRVRRRATAAGHARPSPDPLGCPAEGRAAAGRGSVDRGRRDAARRRAGGPPRRRTRRGRGRG